MCEGKNKNHDCFTFVATGNATVPIELTVNDRKLKAMVDPTMTLLQFLHNELGLFGTKEGCGEGECGACTVIYNGKTATSCLILAAEADGAEVTTVEGLSKNGQLSILQQEFIKQDALQCGFCTPGMLMTSRSLLDRNPDPSDEEIKEALSGNYCRCTGYYPIIKAVKSAAKREREELK